MYTLQKGTKPESQGGGDQQLTLPHIYYCFKTLFSTIEWE